MEVEVRKVKAALTSGTASPDTAASLQCLLSSDACQTSRTSAAARRKPPPGTTRHEKAIATRRKKAVVVTIHEDAPKCLSDREKYALATETVNICLKVLTDLLKPYAKVRERTSSTRIDVDTTTPASKDAAALSQRPLQACSGNGNAVRSPSRSPKATQKRASATVYNLEASLHVVAAAESARLAFAFLRSVDVRKLGIREMPKLQLETGMLALVGNLIGHRLDSLAIEELRIVKRCLEASFGPASNTSMPKIAEASQGNPTKKETLASLLSLNASFDSLSKALPVAVTYHLHVLRIIAASRKPAVIEEALQDLSIDAKDSVADLITRQAKQVGNTSKAAKQLGDLSQIVSSLCPSMSPLADEAAMDRKVYPSPSIIFQLQVLVLRFRRMSWDLAKYEADTQKMVLQPFVRCASAFLRRLPRQSSAADAYGLLKKSFEAITPPEVENSDEALFEIRNVLCTQAERSGLSEESMRWAEAMEKGCNAAAPNHAHRVAATVRREALSIQYEPSRRKHDWHGALSDLLKVALTGNAADYDFLLDSLTHLTRAVIGLQRVEESDGEAMTLLRSATSFALRYARSYPGRRTAQVRAIVDAALRQSKSSDDLLLWVTDDVAKVIIRDGTLHTVAKVAATRPSSEAWSVSSGAVSLDRVLRALVLQAVPSGSWFNSTRVLDDEHQQPEYQGLLLEWQLMYAVELASRTKYHDALRRDLSELLRELSKDYTIVEYPIRRARVACVAITLRESYPDLLPPHVLKIWHDVSEEDIVPSGSDSRLDGYVTDVRASLSVAKAFSAGRPTVSDLQPSMIAWQRIVNYSATGSPLRDTIDDHRRLLRQLTLIAAYYNMLGEDIEGFAVQRLLARVHRLIDKNPSDICTSQVNLARQYLGIGHSEKTGIILAEIGNLVGGSDISKLTMLQYQLALTDYLLASDETDKCRSRLEEVRKLRLDLPPEKVPREDRRTYELLHAQGWLLHSRFALETGSPHQALAAAKRSVRVLNSIWSALERPHGGQRTVAADDAKDSFETDIGRLTTGVSKLQLNAPSRSAPSNVSLQPTKGAAFWPVVPWLTKALVHLSDVYTHHGLFNEANYYSERAICIAESVGSSLLLSRIKSHRSLLLTLAGRTEEAELCLAQDQELDGGNPSLAMAARHCARAAIRAEEGSFREALALYEGAESVVDQLTASAVLVTPEQVDKADNESCRFDQPVPVTKHLVGGLESKRTASATVGKSKQRPHRKAASKPGPSVALKKTRPSPQPDQTERQPSSTCRILEKFRAGILVQKSLTLLRLGQRAKLSSIEADQPIFSGTLLLQERMVQHQDLVQEAAAVLESDVVLNVLAESTLSLPGVRSKIGRPHPDKEFIVGTNPSAQVSGTMLTRVSKRTKDDKKSEAGCERLLIAAGDCLLKEYATMIQGCGTVETHAACAMLSSVTLLFSALSNVQAEEVMPLVTRGPFVDQARNKALHFEEEVVTVERQSVDSAELLGWPTCSDDQSVKSGMAAQFQEEYVDILPRSWTAVSLCLSEDASELYVARYRAGQSPFILRLPFSRHKPDGLDDEAFDYHKGKAELMEIIHLSDFSCHNNSNLQVKGAKTKWWNEREGLDRRLHELLVNIENIWFGGFKAVLSTERCATNHFACFCKSFDDVLHRYLPSRKGKRSASERLALDDQVTELFVGLRDDEYGVVDLDEALADLLYYVVDMLQFHGERNAYDEIDFDGMAVDVLDALRTYHEATQQAEESPQHLILVLDRRLQTFPWESMPCLEGVGVSRVGSMLSLRERILVMRAKQERHASTNEPRDGHEVRRTSGTYILNPSSDLKGTQTMLEPALSSLTQAENASWTSIVNEEPDEDRLGTALSNSAMTLYFGHGGGSQYIRPRSVKRLEKCSEVIWLMGCSSGAISEYGKLEPCAIPLAYLLAGQKDSTSSNDDNPCQLQNDKCMAVVATLWDVTDKDIDRFSLAIGEEWGLWQASRQQKPPAKTARKHEIVGAPLTPQQASKTLNTPRVARTPLPAKTPTRRRTRVEDHKYGKLSLPEAVADSRDTCYLRYLNGAAPVVYGIPVYLSD